MVLIFNYTTSYERMSNEHEWFHTKALCLNEMFLTTRAKTFDKQVLLS